MGVKSLKDARLKSCSSIGREAKVEKVILHHDKMMLVLNNLLMVAEIKMTVNLKARKSLNSWKLKLQQETHEEGRQQMIEAGFKRFRRMQIESHIRKNLFKG